MLHKGSFWFASKGEHSENNSCSLPLKKQNKTHFTFYLAYSTDRQGPYLIWFKIFYPSYVEFEVVFNILYSAINIFIMNISIIREMVNGVCRIVFELCSLWVYDLLIYLLNILA